MTLTHLPEYGQDCYELNGFIVFKTHDHFELHINDGSVTKKEIREFINRCKKSKLVCVVNKWYVSIHKSIPL